MRGTHPREGEGLGQRGIIPAYAGNTCQPRNGQRRNGDHPRVCGEHNPSASSRHFLAGSSPRMRGTPFFGFLQLAGEGIIPAYAGNTHDGTTIQLHCRDHPRVCGEHCLIDSSRIGLSGSSPRMRGTPAADSASGALRGIIPAYAGNTRNLRLFLYLRGDHPRVCGEHFSTFGVISSHGGSSPRMRGTPCKPSGALP